MSKLKLKQIDNVNGTDGAVIVKDGTTNKWSNEVKAIQLPSGDTASRPETATEGMVRFNTDLDALETFTNGAWTQVGGAGAYDGFDINLGAITKGDGSWTPGAVPLTDTVKVSDAIDSLNEVLSKLIPSQPPNFPNGQALTVSNTSGSTPFLASGAVPNNTGDALPTAGTLVTRISTSTVNSNMFNDMGPGDSGLVSLLLNGTSLGSKTLTGSGDAGTYSGLRIADQKDFPVATPGFWKSIDIDVNGATVPAGYNKMKLTHSAAGSTNDVYFVSDTMTTVPVISSPTVVENAQGTLAYSSSVPHYGTGASLTVGCSITRLAGETYYGGSDPLVVSGTNSIMSNKTFTYAGLGITTPIARQTLAATAITPVTIAIDGTTHGMGVIQAVAKNVNGSSSTTALSSSNILVKNGTVPAGKVDELNVSVTIPTGSGPTGNASRVDMAGGNNPVGSGTVWNSSSALDTWDATVVAGVLKHDTTNYTVGYFPVGPDLSGQAADQYVTFAFRRSAVSKFDINVSGSYADLWVKLPGLTENYTSSSNGWYSMKSQYTGSGMPGDTNGANGSLGCALSASANGTGSWTCTFGTLSSTNATDNMILVRFRLTAGQSISSLSFVPATR